MTAYLRFKFRKIYLFANNVDGKRTMYISLANPFGINKHSHDNNNNNNNGSKSSKRKQNNATPYEMNLSWEWGFWNFSFENNILLN